MTRARLAVKILSIGLGLALTLGIAPLGHAADARLGLPVWTLGDTWTYSFHGTGSRSNATAIVRMDVVGTILVIVDGSSFPSYRTEITVQAAIGSLRFTLSGTLWFRVSDLNLIKAAMPMQLLGLPADAITTYDPPQGLRWPLVEGSSWSSTTSASTEIRMPGENPITRDTTFTLAFSAQPSQTLTVPAGTFSTTPVVASSVVPGYWQELWLSTLGIYGDHWQEFWSSQTGNWVEMKVFDSTDQELGTTTLTTYSHQVNPAAGGLPNILDPLWIGVILVALTVVLVAAAFGKRRPRPPREGEIP